ncbi:MAG: hypothetical protein CM1200mP22_05760 [Dehalococcoidia bacterium]|nr:MAG: hypothetical protein CM1200mP22_05760 [Dehalococcoidia bacterium]
MPLFGMVGLDFETAVLKQYPNYHSSAEQLVHGALETKQMADSHNLYGTRDLGGNYADLGKAMGGGR